MASRSAAAHSERFWPPVGPRRITSVRQVAIPARLLAEVGLDIGSEIYFSMSADRRIVLIPAADLDVGGGAP